MSNFIAGAIGMLLICSFLIGLAVSIGSVPFGIIVAVVLTMALVDFFQSVVSNWKQDSD
jgi:hypothetical protein